MTYDQDAVLKARYHAQSLRDCLFLAFWFEGGEAHLEELHLKRAITYFEMLVPLIEKLKGKPEPVRHQQVEDLFSDEIPS